MAIITAPYWDEVAISIYCTVQWTPAICRAQGQSSPANRENRCIIHSHNEFTDGGEKIKPKSYWKKDDKMPVSVPHKNVE